MKQFHVNLLGSFRLIRDGVEVASRDWHTRQARQLFKVLLAERGRLVSTRRLIDLLWPENVEHAHKALRSAVSALRDTLEPDREPWLVSSFVPRGQEGYALTFPEDCDVQVDVFEFEKLLDASLEGSNTPENRATLRSALDLYLGDYLSEDRDATWTVAERMRLRERYFTGVVRWMRWQRDVGFYDEVLRVGWRALDFDPCRESLYRLIMQCQALAGDNAAALQTFELCRQTLDNHLGTDPSQRTLKLHMAILRGEFPASTRPKIVSVPQRVFASYDVGQDVEGRSLTQRLVETQKQALHYTMQAADYARQACNYRQALVDYEAAMRLLQGPTSQHDGKNGESAEWWGQLYHGRGMVYEALLDWQGIEESHRYLSHWAATKQDPTLTSGSVQRMIVSRSLKGYLFEAVNMAREFVDSLQSEYENSLTLLPQTRERLSILTDMSKRWTHIMTLDDCDDCGSQPSVAMLPDFCPGSSPGVSDWERVVDLLGPLQSAGILTSYGWTLSLQGFSDGERCLQAALKAAHATGQVTWEILASLHLSQAYYSVGNSEQGLQEFTHCLSLCQQVPEATWVSFWPLLTRAYHLVYVKQLDEAEQIFDQVQEQIMGQDLPSFRCSAQVGQGLIALAREQFDRAHTLLSDALVQRQHLYIEVYVAAEMGMADIERHHGAYADARKRLQRMLDFSGKRGLLRIYVDSAFSLARLSLHTQQAQGIAELLENVHRLVTSVGADTLINKCVTLQSRFS